MKKSFFIGIFTLICSSLLGSSNDEQKEFGYLFDINGLPLNNYCDFDYQPKKQFEVEISIGQEPSPGVYYDLSGKKHEGLISIDTSSSFQFGMTDLLFCFEKNTDREVEITPNNCVGLRIGNDSFTTISHFEIKYFLMKKAIDDLKFVEVLLKTSDFEVYRYRKVGMGIPDDTYIIKTDSSKNYKTIFNENALLELFGSFNLIRKKIFEKKYYEDNTLTVSVLYDYKRKKDGKKKLYYSCSWDEVADSSKATYYAKILSLKDSIWELRFYNMHGVPIYLGHFSSFMPSIKDGYFLWYYPNGAIRKKIFYKENIITEQVVEFFQDGMPHYYYKVKNDEFVYDSVFDVNGKQILNKNGFGSEEIYDSIAKRKLIIKFAENKINLCGYKDSSLVLLKSTQMPKIKHLGSIQRKIENGFNYPFRQEKGLKYPLKALENNVHGYVLVKFSIDSIGNILHYEIIKGVNEEIDKNVMRFLSNKELNVEFEPAMYKGVRFFSEVVVPFNFVINTLIPQNSLNYIDNWMFWDQQIMNQAPKIPSLPIK